MSSTDVGPVLFAYDGSDLAGLAIEEAGRQLEPGRDAVVLTVWRPFLVGFIPPAEIEFDAAATYPDLGCNFETFTNEEILEIESLGPLVTLARPRNASSPSSQPSSDRTSPGASSPQTCTVTSVPAADSALIGTYSP